MLTMKPAPPVPSRVTYLRLYLLDSIVKPSNFQEAKNHSKQQAVVIFTSPKVDGFGKG